MTTLVQLGGHVTGLGATKRQERWWVGPALTVAGLLLFVAYSTWAAFQGQHYYVGTEHGGYLSPMYSPPLFIKGGVPGGAPVGHAWIGSWPSWWPAFLPASPALLILAFPGALRFTCYYYRKAYYRSFTGTPPGCAVGSLPQKRYKGETSLLLFQNLHRYALYFALPYIPILYYDAWEGLFRNGELGVGVGTVVMFVNATLLGAFTFGCHAWRHLIGGRVDCFSCDAVSRTRYKAWKISSFFNARHQLFAWVSLFWVMGTDLYIRLLSMGVIHDFNTWR